MKYEGEERQALRELFASQGWKILVKEMEDLLHRNRSFMMEEYDRDTMFRRQGYDLAMRKFLELEDMTLEKERLAQFAQIRDLSHLRVEEEKDNGRRVRDHARGR